jgi:hypothetical protein
MAGDGRAEGEKSSTKALRQLKTDRERAEVNEAEQKKAGEEARIRFARIKSTVVGPVFDEVVARLNDASFAKTRGGKSPAAAH